VEVYVDEKRLVQDRGHYKGKFTKMKKPDETSGFGGGYRGRTDDLLHAMQAL
jgi:hypothetical protein